MRVVICGIGTVGGELARRMVTARHDVTIVDPSKATCDQYYAQYGIVAICGEATRLEVLEEAEVAKADLLIATSPDDAHNLACSMLAKAMGVSQTIVRLHNKAYMAAYKIAGVSAVVPVTDLTVNHLMMEIEHPRATNISSIGEGRAEIFMVVIREGSWVVGQTVRDVAADAEFPSECVFVACYRPATEQCVIPRGGYQFDIGDEVYLGAMARDLESAVDCLLRTG